MRPRFVKNRINVKIRTPQRELEKIVWSKKKLCGASAFDNVEARWKPLYIIQLYLGWDWSVGIAMGTDFAPLLIDLFLYPLSGRIYLKEWEEFVFAVTALRLPYLVYI